MDKEMNEQDYGNTSTLQLPQVRRNEHSKMVEKNFVRPDLTSFGGSENSRKY